MSRYRDLKTLSYRVAVETKDAHGIVRKGFDTDLSTIKGSLRPQTLTQEVKDVGLVLTGDYLVYIPTNIQVNIDIKQGDGFYIGSDDTNKDPKWFVSNTPYNYLNHIILVLKSKK